MKIELNYKIPEANIQAELYHQCRNAGINILLEYKTNNCRLDAAIYNKDHEILCIIEVKSYARETQPVNTDTKQLNKYRQLGINVHVLGRMEKINELVANLIKYYPECLDDTPKLKIKGKHNIINF